MTYHSEQINELMTALAKAQGEMSHATKDSFNPHFKSKFADLASVWCACREPLAKNGLAITQTMHADNGQSSLVTMLGHSSGQWMKSSIVVHPTSKPQEMGILLSYYRRYMLAAMVGVYQDDDDAETIEKQTRTRQEQAKLSPEIQPITETQYQVIMANLEDFPEAGEWLSKHFKVDNIRHLLQKDFPYIVGIFNKKRADKVDK